MKGLTDTNHPWQEVARGEDPPVAIGWCALCGAINWNNEIIYPQIAEDPEELEVTCGESRKAG